MKALYFVDYNALTARAFWVDFISARLVIIAIGIQDLDILLCHVVMPVFISCRSFHTYAGLKNFAARSATSQ